MASETPAQATKVVSCPSSGTISLHYNDSTSITSRDSAGEVEGTSGAAILPGEAPADEAVIALLSWRRRKAKSLAAKRLFSQAERFRLEDMIELWLHWLSSGKPVRVEAALYSAMTFFTGARAIEIGNLMIEDLRLNPDGSALVMPIRQSKTNEGHPGKVDTPFHGQLPP